MGRALTVVAAMLVLASPALARPNVVVVMTDDQDARSVRVMDTVRSQLRARGTTFENFFATFPLCCPSRATFLTGQYAHNHSVSSYEQFDDSEALPVWLQRAGYRTGFIGKYLNGYDATRNEHVPPGWDSWHASVSHTHARMFDYTLNENGRFRDYGSAPRDYRTDVEGRKAAGFIRGGSKPFFLTVATLAPHGETRLFGEPRNPRPAPRHAQRFEDEPLPRPPSFNERNVADKPSFVRDLPRVDAETGSKWKEHHQDRLATLLAVDDVIRRIIAALRETGQLRNTLVILTSDNGFLLGEHRLKNKRELYEESARVPLVLRGPGVPEGAVREQVTGNIDLAPTILDAANAEAGSVMDGQSLLPFAEDPAHRRNRSILLENVIGKKWPYESQAVRAPGAVYAEHSTGEEELYDLDADPFQLQSLHDAPAYAATEDTLDRRLEALRDCAGAGCR